jgi:uncharacterized protein (TIGR02300 family)
VVKPELGVKRRCLSCTKAFFDLNRKPIVCPTCKTVFQVVELAHSAPRRGMAPPVGVDRRAAAVPAPADSALPLVEAVDEEDTTPVEIEEIEDEEQVEIQALI